jgi:hypothetical protein
MVTESWNTLYYDMPATTLSHKFKNYVTGFIFYFQLEELNTTGLTLHLLLRFRNQFVTGYYIKIFQHQTSMKFTYLYITLYKWLPDLSWEVRIHKLPYKTKSITRRGNMSSAWNVDIFPLPIIWFSCILFQECPYMCFRCLPDKHLACTYLNLSILFHKAFNFWMEGKLV